MEKSKMNKRGTIAIGEILIMILGTFAISWAIGDEVGAADPYTAERTSFYDELQKMDDSSNSFTQTDVDIFVPHPTEQSMFIEGSTPGVGPPPSSAAVPTRSPSLNMDQMYNDEILAQDQGFLANPPQTQPGSTPNPAAPTRPPVPTPKADAGAPKPETPNTETNGNVPPKPPVETPKTISVGSSLWSGLKWGMTTAAVVGFINLFASKSSIGKYTEALQIAAPVGVLVGKSLWDMASEGGAIYRGVSPDSFLTKSIFEGGKVNWGQGISFGIGAAVTIAIFIMMYSEEETERIIFNCEPWDAPSGGNDCEKCNNNKDLPCSEYQCKSLGQSCELQNANSDMPLCSWVNRHDVVPPKITLWEEVLTAGLKYTPLGASSPQDRGTQIVSIETGKCIPAYTPLAVGLKTDEPAKCKVDLLSKKNFSEMGHYFGSSLFLYNHTLVMSVPGQTVEEGEDKVELKNDGIVQLYVRCQDPNGNVNEGNFVFKFCVDAGEDTTAPLILGTNILNEMPVAFNTSSIALELYTNEPADCRWDALDKGNYEEMKNTMICNQNAIEMNAQMVYTCKTNLNGIKSGTGNANNFYFKCRDKSTASSGRNTQTDNHKLTLYGTEPLILDEVKPNGTTIKDNTDPVWVELTAKTSAGYKDGDSSCYYKLPTYREYIKFSTTGNSTHSQRLSFETGTYNASIKCVDAGGNSAEKSLTFEVEIDRSSPEIQRIYKDENNLRTITNEDAECVYDTSSCSYQFNDGIAMVTSGGTSQFTEWKQDQTYYIKCKDKYGNQPDAGSCTIEARMYERL